MADILHRLPPNASTTTAIFIHVNPDSVEETIRLVDLIREKERG